MTAGKSVSTSIGRAMALYALASTVAIGLAGGVFTAIYSAPMDRQAVWVSALVALVVQMVAFAIARLMNSTGHGIAGWGLGAVICLTAMSFMVSPVERLACRRTRRC